MTKKQLKELLGKSYTKDKLDSEKVEMIANVLPRRDLKNYIRGIKTWEKRKNIVISLPYLPSEEEKRKLESLYPKKSLIYDIDPELLVGVRVNENDTIMDFSARNALNNLLEHLDQTYD